MEIKEFVKKHKKKLLIGGGVVLGSVLAWRGLSLGLIHPVKDTKPLERIVKIPGWDLTIPEIGKDLGVQEYFREDGLVRCVFADTEIANLGVFGKALVDSFEADPDSRMWLVLEYLGKN